MRRLPRIAGKLEEHIIHRELRLQCLTSAFAPLWEECTGDQWTPDVGWRLARDRREAQLELDVLIAMSLGVAIDELITIYRTQFPVLVGYDRNEYLYDANGRLVPTAIRQRWRNLGEPSGPDRMSSDERTAIHPGSGVAYTYDLPFRFLDREADMREAYARFEAEL